LARIDLDPCALDHLEVDLDVSNNKLKVRRAEPLGPQVIGSDVRLFDRQNFNWSRIAASPAEDDASVVSRVVV
jgi:hypothetical protein